MEPLSWATVANLILELGVPAAERLVQLWENKQEVTLAEFQALAALANKTAKDEMSSRLVAAGIALDSPQAKILLGLTDAPPNLTVDVPIPPGSQVPPKPS